VVAALPLGWAATAHPFRAHEQDDYRDRTKHAP
jgi:hypothetical protein